MCLGESSPPSSSSSDGGWEENRWEWTGETRDEGNRWEWAGEAWDEGREWVGGTWNEGNGWEWMGETWAEGNVCVVNVREWDTCLGAVWGAGTGVEAAGGLPTSNSRRH